MLFKLPESPLSQVVGHLYVKINKDVVAALKVSMPTADDKIGRKVTFGEIAINDTLAAYPEAGGQTGIFADQGEAVVGLARRIVV